MTTEKKLHALPPAEQATPDNGQTTALNPFDPARLRMDLNFAEGVSVKKIIVTIPVRKPHDQEFFRVRPEPNFHLSTALITLRDDKETFLVAPEIARSIPGEYKLSTLYTVISRAGNLSLWPVPLPGADGRQNNWHTSATTAAETAMKKWIRIKANMALGAYDPFEAQVKIPEPEWPDLTFDRMLEIAFRGRLVDSFDHEVLKRLRGET